MSDQLAEILISRDAVFPSLDEDGINNLKRTVPAVVYDEIADIPVRITARVTLPQTGDLDDGPEIEDLEAEVTERITNEDGDKLIFEKGERIHLTSAEMEQAAEALINRARR